MNLIRFSVLGLGWFLAVTSLNANPCVNPKRTISGYSVDLRPLMEWWAEPKGPRPLSGWKHARGRIVREVPLGWVVEGKVEGAPTPLMFLVKNPPRERLQKYRQLQNQLAQYTRAAESTQQYLQRPVCTDWYSYYLTQWPSPPISLADYRQASSTMTDLYNKLQAVRDELATMQDADGQFQLDAFALPKFTTAFLFTTTAAPPPSFRPRKRLNLFENSPPIRPTPSRSPSTRAAHRCNASSLA